MNAGAMGAETFDHVASVKMVDANGDVFEKAAEEIRHFYRNVPELVNNIVVSALFQGEQSPDHEIAAMMEASKVKRRSSQPIAASAGCIFKNPKSIGAGQLIDELGMKGYSFGEARVSDVHGNFIVNKKRATARQVLDLIGQIKKKALEERGIELEVEVQIIGQDDPI